MLVNTSQLLQLREQQGHPHCETFFSLTMATLTSSEREAQKTYWIEHSSEPTVEAMMLDSKAAEIDQLERPEVMLRPQVQA